MELVLGLGTDAQGLLQVLKGQAEHHIAIVIGGRFFQRNLHSQSHDERRREHGLIVQFLYDFPPGRVAPVNVPLIFSAPESRQSASILRFQRSLLLNPRQGQRTLSKENARSPVLWICHINRCRF